PVGLHGETQNVITGRDVHVVRGQRRPLLPAPGIRNRQRSGDVAAVDLEMEVAAGAAGGHAEIDIVRTGVSDTDGVLQPLARFGPADVVPFTLVAGFLHIDAPGAILVPEVRLSGVVISDTFAPL